MNDKVAYLLAAALSTVMPPIVSAQESNPAIGEWKGCFAPSDTGAPSACGTIRLDSLPVCGEAAKATYFIPFDQLRLPASTLSKQGYLVWRRLRGGRVELFSMPEQAQTPEGETVCVLSQTYLSAWGWIKGDSLTGSWDWGEIDGRTSGTFRLIRSGD